MQLHVNDTTGAFVRSLREKNGTKEKHRVSQKRLRRKKVNFLNLSILILLNKLVLFPFRNFTVELNSSSWVGWMEWSEQKKERINLFYPRA